MISREGLVHVKISGLSHYSWLWLGQMYRLQRNKAKSRWTIGINDNHSFSTKSSNNLNKFLCTASSAVYLQGIPCETGIELEERRRQEYLNSKESSITTDSVENLKFLSIIQLSIMYIILTSLARCQSFKLFN